MCALSRVRASNWNGSKTPAMRIRPAGAQAAEARIYWDAGTGTIDWSAPKATVPMNHPTAATRYT